MRRPLGPPLLALALLGTGVTEAVEPAAVLGSIRGRVELHRVPPPVEPRLEVSDLGTPSPRDAPDRRRCVVYLETAPRGAFEEAGGRRATLDQRNQTFVPYVLPVTVGTTVDFPNNDRTYHNVFSFSKARRFDLGRYGRGQSKALRFDEPGVVRVFCEIHSHMSAFILVFAHRYFSVTDVEGRYHIDDVPPGSYTVVAWSDGEARQSRPVRVPEGGGPVELDFALN